MMNVISKLQSDLQDYLFKTYLIITLGYLFYHNELTKLKLRCHSYVLHTFITNSAGIEKQFPADTSIHLIAILHIPK